MSHFSKTHWMQKTIVPLRSKSKHLSNHEEQTPGILDLIRQAASVEDLDNLLRLTETGFKEASPGTVRKWLKASSLKRVELQEKINASK